MSSTSPPAAPADKSRILSSTVFLLAVYSGLLAYLWWIIPTRNTALIAAGAVIILVILAGDPIRRRESPASIGLTGRNLGGAFRLLAAPTILIAAILIGVGLAVPGGGAGHRFLKRFIEILPWALLQQGLLQATFNRRMTQAFGAGLKTSVANGVFFGLMHLPGPALTIGTFLAGIGWSRVYQKRPNLWALILSHALLSATAQSFLPAAWTHGFRVGPGYFRWP